MASSRKNTSSALEKLRDLLSQSPSPSLHREIHALLGECGELEDGRVVQEYAIQHMSARWTRQLSRGRADLALEAMVDAWGATRAPELEAPIRRLGERLAPLVPPVGEDPERDFIDRCRLNRASDTPTLVAFLLEPPKRNISKRLRSLLERKPDPRTRDILLAMIANPPTTSSSNFTVWTQLFKVLPDYADLGQAHILETRMTATPPASYPGGEPSLFWGQLNKLIETALPRLPAPISLNLPGLMEAVERASLPAVLDAPDEDEVEPVTSLEGAAAVVGSDVEAALDQLVWFWGQRRLPEVAELIDRLGRILARTQPPLEGGSTSAVHRRWLKLAAGARPSQTGPLLRQLSQGRREEVEDRLEEMLTWAPDPRASALMFTFIDDIMLGGRVRFWELVYRNLAHHADARLATRFGEHQREMDSRGYRGDRFRAEYRALTASQDEILAAAQPPGAPTAEELAHLKAIEAVAERLEAGEDRKRQEEHRLLTEVVARWGEDAPVAAYVAWLKGQGDPRGEFIELERALADGKRVQGKRDKHLKQHRGDILGVLHDLCDNVTWEQGLLRTLRCTFLSRGGGLPPHLDPEVVAADPRWRTLESLDCRSANLAPILEGAALTSLKHLSAVRPEALVGLGRRTSPMPVVSIDFDAEPESDWSGLQDAHGALPALRDVHITLWTRQGHRDVPPLAFFDNPLMRRVAQITNGGPHTGGFPNLALWLERQRQAGAVAALHIQNGIMEVVCAPMSDGSYDVVMTVPRLGEDRRLTPRDVVRAIEALPTGLVSRLLVRGAEGRAVPDEIREAMARFKPVDGVARLAPGDVGGTSGAGSSASSSGAGQGDRLRAAGSAVVGAASGGPLRPGEQAAYEESGYVLTRRFLPADVEALKQEVLALAAEPGEQRFMEDDGQTLRSYNGAHLHSALVRRWACSPQLLEPVRQLVGGDVYLYQTRMILKAPFSGGAWPWHQDFRYWMVEDSVREPHMVLATVFLDDVTPANSPLMVLRGSHKLGAIELESRTQATERGDYRANLGTDGEFVLGPALIEELTGRLGCDEVVGEAGSVLFFHPNLMHASRENISPRSRALMYFVYNRVDNAPEPSLMHRPDFLCARDFTPLRLESER